MSNMMESFAQARHAERYATARDSATRGEAPGKLHSRRARAGWLLVGLGLRLALPSRQDAGRGITLSGR